MFYSLVPLNVAGRSIGTIIYIIVVGPTQLGKVSVFDRKRWSSA